MEFTFEAQQDMTFYAPMVGEVARAVFHEANADTAELLRAPEGCSRLPRMLGGLYLRPAVMPSGMSFISIIYSDK